MVQDSVDLPEGAEVELQVVDEDDGLTPEERERLHAVIASSRESIGRGEGIPAQQVVQELWEAHTSTTR